MSRTRDISNIYNSDDFAGENIVSISSNYTAVDKDVIFVNTASSALTITLPANPTTGSKVKILDSASNATTNNITISGNGNKIGGSSNNYVINVVDSILSLLYIDSSRGWFLENSYVPLDLPGKPTSASAVDIGTSRAYNNGAATITFIASEAGGIADYYEVVSSPGAISASGAFSPIIVSGLQSGVSYSFAVRAKNAAGYSAYSISSNSITATTVPQAPTINTATASGIDSATITFSANGTGGKTITNYTATSSPSSITSSASASPITFLNTLTNGTSYTFTLTATNANGTSAASSSSSSVVPFTSSGGTATTANGYRTHVFTGAGTFTYTGSARSMEYLIVGGGGGGNNADGVAGSTGGGGGGGGYLSGTSTIGTGTYTVVVGAGSPEATKGIDSSFNSLTAVGGGQGGGHNGGGGSGGSGGGGGGAWNNSTPGGAGTSGQGNSGGYGAGRDGGGGGGGGAGGTGSNGGGTYGGNGGLGLSTGISGSTLYYSGGGGGGGSWTCNGCGGTGGSGVGANGGSSGSSASANTGGGGGGGYLGGAGSGGSGVVIVRYAL